jgi:hypothetical protein
MTQNTALIDENCEQHFCLASILASLSSDVRPSFKRPKRLKTLNTARGILSNPILIISYVSVQVFVKF